MDRRGVWSFCFYNIYAILILNVILFLIREVFKIKQEMISYFRSKNYDVEFIYSKNCKNSFQEHNHVSTYTIGLLLEGSIKLKRKNEFITCEKDHFFIIPPYEPHAIIADDLYTMVSISIKVDFVLKYNMEEALPRLLELAGSLMEKDIISHSSLQVISDAVNKLFLSIVSEYECDDSIQSIKKALEQIPRQEVSVDELSQSVFMSKYHFIREFKKQVGLTPHHFQIQTQIRKAQSFLLEYGNASITEVALATGFYDQSHFIKSFKKIVGLTPSQYVEAQYIVND